MMVSVALGSCGSRLGGSASFHLAKYTTLHARTSDAAADSAGSKMFNPWRSRKKVCSPNNRVTCGITGWFSGIASASNWLKVRSTCADVNCIAHSSLLLGWIDARKTRFIASCGASHLEWSNVFGRLGHPAPSHLGYRHAGSSEGDTGEATFPSSVT